MRAMRYVAFTGLLLLVGCAKPNPPEPVVKARAPGVPERYKSPAMDRKSSPIPAGFGTPPFHERVPTSSVAGR